MLREKERGKKNLPSKDNIGLEISQEYEVLLCDSGNQAFPRK